MSDSQAISFMTWNINGLKTKVARFREVADEFKVNIAFLQETHIGKHEMRITQRELEGRGWTFYSAGNSSRSKGVAILIRKTDFKDFEYLTDDHDVEGTFLILKCKIDGQFFTLISMYQHSSEGNITEKLVSYLQDCRAGVLLIGGDFNTSLHSYLDRTSRTQNDKHTAHRRWVQDFMAHLSLVDVWRSSRPMDREYTYCKNGGESRLDYIFMQEEFMWRVKTCEILETPKEHSDHKPVWLQFTTSAPSQRSSPKQKDIWKKYFLSENADFSHRDDRIKLIDITRALRSILMSDLPRPDGIPVEYYKSNIDNVSDNLKVLYNQMLENTIDDATIQMFSKDPIRVSDDNPYHIFSVVYLILAKILATHLKKHLNAVPELTPNTDENNILKVFQAGSSRKLKWSLLEEAIEVLEDDILLPHIFDKLLSPNQESDCIELRDGCPLTSPLLLLYWKHLLDKSIEQISQSWPQNQAPKTIVHSETVAIRFSSRPDASLLNKMKEKLWAMHDLAN